MNNKFGNGITEVQQQLLFLENLKLNSKLAECDQKHHHRMTEIRENGEINKELIDMREQAYLKRGLISHGVSVNSKGFICKEVIGPNDESAGTIPVVNVTNMAFTKFICKTGVGLDKAYLLNWDGDDGGIIFSEESLNPSNFAKALHKKGLKFSTSKDTKGNITDLVMAYLIKHAMEVEIPRCYGWNLYPDRADWVKPPQIVMEEVERYAI